VLFSKASACGPLSALKKDYRCSHPHVNTDSEGDRYSKLKIYISELILNRY
jgi:hypothetical protein